MQCIIRLEAFASPHSPNKIYAASLYSTPKAVYSCGKTATALVVGILVDKALISYDARVAEYWPEFGCNGKENMILADLLKHQVSPFSKLCFAK